MEISRLFHLIIIGLLFVSQAHADEPKNETKPALPTSPTPSPEVKPVAIQSPSETESAKPRKYTFFVGLDYNTGSELKFNNASGTNNNTGASAVGTFEYQTDAAPSISIGIENMSEMSWGFESAFIIEQKRNVNSAQVAFNGNSASANYADPRPTLQMDFLEANAIYRWSLIYLPFGLNYSIPTFATSAGATGSVSVKGAIGAQVGIGFYFNDHIRFEFLSRAIGVSETETSGAYSYNLGQGYMSSTELRFKYAF